MAKPPRPTKPGGNTDTPSTVTKPSTETRGREDGSTNVPRPVPDSERPWDSNTTPPSGYTSGTVPNRPVVITEMPTAAIGIADATRMISWPREQVEQLLRIDNTGLFMDSQEHLYADIGVEGIFRIEKNANNEFQIPLPFAPGQAGPILMKVPGQPQWRIARPGQVDPVLPVAKPANLELIAPHLADKLTRPDSNGIRFDKLKRTYVDLADGGTVLIRKNTQGDYQASSTSESTPSGPVLESIEGMTLWQRKSPVAEWPASDQAGPGPNQRPRLEQDADGGDDGIDADVSRRNPYLWASWGKTSQPVSGESIQIGQLFYRIVPKGALTGQVPLVFLQHPDFAPGRFEPFERMLQEAPSLQPVIALRSRPQVVSSSIRPFAKPLTHHVGDVFKRFTQNTSRAVAKRLFEASGSLRDIDGTGLARMMQTFRHWEGKTRVAVNKFGDPLDMLPVAAGSTGTRRIVPLHAADSPMPLQQLNLKPESSPVWHLYKDRLDEPGHLSLLVATLLSESSYTVFLPANAEHLKILPPMLLFKRNNHDKVYFLKLGYIDTDAIEIHPPSVPELADPMLHRRMSTEGHQALLAADVHGDVVWLIGGVQHLPGADPSIFIIKER
jgi:hypothetical protein